MGKVRRLLVVSDLHVGRDCKQITGFSQPRPDPEFDQAFIHFLDYYTSGTESDWKLVLAGDFIDFMEVVVVPEAKGFLDLKLTFDVTDEEREFGLGSEAERVIIKLERTLEYHRAFFQRMARFVKAGGEVVVMRGNHDVEFYWPKVQHFFRRALADMAFQGDKLEVDQALEQRGQFQERVLIAPWIYHEPGRIYIEHGHQYDVYCSFDHWLHPVSPTHPRRIDTPISAFAMRYFVNLLSDFAAADVDFWHWKDYLRWLRQKGFAGSIYAAKGGFGAMVRMLAYAVRWTFGRVGRYHQEHKQKLAEEAARFSIPLEKLALIDGLHHTPVSRNLPELMRLLFLDRILLIAGTLLLGLVCLLVVEPAWAELVTLFAIGVLALRINKRMAPRRFLSPGPKQAVAARRIAEILDVPLVVMGHSHMRRDEPIGHGRRYINTGCWLPPRGKDDHVDPAQRCTCKLSHLLVETEGEAELRVFCKATATVRLADVREASSVAFERERQAVEAPAEGLVP